MAVALLRGVAALDAKQGACIEWGYPGRREASGSTTTIGARPAAAGRVRGQTSKGNRAAAGQDRRQTLSLLLTWRGLGRALEEPRAAASSHRVDGVDFTRSANCHVCHRGRM